MKNKLVLMTLVLLIFLPILLISQQEEKQNFWQPFLFFVGKWEGKGEGKPGISQGSQEFQFIMKGRYLIVKNTSRFEPQERNPRGETHEDWGFFSFDQRRKKFVLRQFHIEGFVNQYVCESISDDGKTFVFVSEQIENIPSGWKAKLTYKIINKDEFEQSFELAAPGKEMECYSKGVMRREK